MYVISGQLALEITLGPNKTPLPLDTGNLQHIHLIESVARNPPQMQICFRDVTNAVLANSLGDGTLINVSIGKLEDRGAVKPIVFRVFSIPQAGPTSGGGMYIINCFLDKPKFTRGLVVGGYSGTSDAAMKKLADACDLVYESELKGDDEMSWLSAKKSYLGLANHICDHAYINETSCTSFAVNTDGILKFVDLAALAKKRPKGLFYYKDLAMVPQDIRTRTSPNHFQITDFTAKSSAGFMNNWMGYGYKQTQEQLDGTFTEHKKVKATRLSNSFDINKEVAGQVENVRNVYTPPDCGNTHKSFVKAFHQNKRLKTIYSNPIELVTEGFTDLTLYDLVYVDLIDKADNTQQTNNSGLYFVSGKARSIMNNQYYEKYTLLSTGKNVNPTGERV